MKKRITFSLVFLLCVAAFISFIKFEENILETSNQIEANKKTIIIDAGHGGFDGGAVASDGTSEKDINLKIAQNLRDFLSYAGFDVIMTRNTDSSTATIEDKNSKKLSDLKNRIKLMYENRDSIFVSIHLNKFTTTSANGAQVFYSQNAEGSDILAQTLQNSIKNLIQPNNSRVIKRGTSSIYILKNAVVPTAIVECGFLSNQAELEKLKDEKYQSMMAFSIFCGIMEYHSNSGK